MAHRPRALSLEMQISPCHIPGPQNFTGRRSAERLKPLSMALKAMGSNTVCMGNFFKTLSVHPAANGQRTLWGR